ERHIRGLHHAIGALTLEAPMHPCVAGAIHLADQRIDLLALHIGHLRLHVVGLALWSTSPRACKRLGPRAARPLVNEGKWTGRNRCSSNARALARAGSVSLRAAGGPPAVPDLRYCATGGAGCCR